MIVCLSVRSHWITKSESSHTEEIYRKGKRGIVENRTAFLVAPCFRQASPHHPIVQPEGSDGGPVRGFQNGSRDSHGSGGGTAVVLLPNGGKVMSCPEVHSNSSDSSVV